MKLFLKLLKWTSLLIGSVLLLIMLTGLVFRLSSSKPEPPGELVDIGNFKLHINRSGEKNDQPTLVIEGGSGMATEFYHWLNEGMKDHLRVVRYDRAGIGHSEASNTPRDPETIARELHILLEKAGESPPYILAGHSLGGPYIQVFAQLYPEEVAAIALLDATHPWRIKTFNIPSPTSFKFKSMVWLYDFQGLLADLGILKLYDQLAGPILNREMEGLPDEVNQRTIDFLNNGKYIRAFGKEFEQYHNTLERVATKNDFGFLPIRIFPAASTSEIPEEVYRKYLKRGIDLRKGKIKKMSMQEDFLKLSTNSKLIPIDGNHTSIFTEKENADIICKEIIRLSQELKEKRLPQKPVVL
ncbi:MAG: alpha/beta hydrolase [Saprospiraceae bacterium]